MKRSLETLPIRANVLLIGTDPRTGRIVERVLAHNQVVTSGKVLVARMLMEDSGFDTGITKCEIGTSGAAVAVTQTALVAAHARAAITSYIRTAAVVQFRTYYTAAASTAFIREVGLFGHSTAGAGLGTGEMFNRALVTFDNTLGTKDLTVVVQVTFG